MEKKLKARKVCSSQPFLSSFVHSYSPTNKHAHTQGPRSRTLTKNEDEPWIFYEGGAWISVKRLFYVGDNILALIRLLFWLESKKPQQVIEAKTCNCKMIRVLFFFLFCFYRRGLWRVLSLVHVYLSRLRERNSGSGVDWRLKKCRWCMREERGKLYCNCSCAPLILTIQSEIIVS